MNEFRLFPEDASTMAGEIDAVYFAMIGFSAFFTVLIVAAITFFAIRYRRGSKASRANRVNSSVFVEVTWILLPATALFAIFFWACAVFLDVNRMPEDALPVYVVGKQWMWKFQHPSGAREINDLHVPAGRPVVLTMTSQDVIHSLYFPAFRVKQDVLPARYTRLWFEADVPGEYHLLCAEYCGTSHSRMGGRIIVLEPEEYSRWAELQAADETLAARGLALFNQHGCAGCHGTNANYNAPRLEGLFGREVTLQDGDSIVADMGYIRDSILLPKKNVVAGYKPIMPSFEGQLSEEDIFALIAWIRSTSAETEEVAAP
ncbi:MAG: cytochrome c oxidase subunit II [Sumerlaeia bacterium]